MTLFAFVALLSGCGQRPITEGTEGILRFRGEPVADIRVTVNRIDKKAVNVVGYGVTAADGTFRLVTQGGHAGLKLEPGDYCCTLKSVGAPVRIPNECAQVNTTPLKVSWSEGNKSLNLEVRGTSAQTPSH
jgi:hypothetical protein